MQGLLLKDQLEIIRTKGPDGSPRYGIKPLPSEVPFDKGLFVFVRAVQLLTSRNKDTIVVGLAGPSGAGKTAFAKKIRNEVCAVVIVGAFSGSGPFLVKEAYA